MKKLLLVVCSLISVSLMSGCLDGSEPSEHKERFEELLDYYCGFEYGHEEVFFGGDVIINGVTYTSTTVTRYDGNYVHEVRTETSDDGEPDVVNEKFYEYNGASRDVYTKNFYGEWGMKTETCDERITQDLSSYDFEYNDGVYTVKISMFTLSIDVVNDVIYGLFGEVLTKFGEVSITLPTIN